MAVFLVDDYTGNQPIGGVKVFLEGQDLKSVKNPSGYYLFLDLPGTEYRVRVISDHYFAETIPVILADLATGQPVVDIKLKPKPSYPFPSGATLIRGMVYYPGDEPVNGALVEIKDKVFNNRTTKKGEFVLYFIYLDDDSSITNDDEKRKFILGNTDQVVTLLVSKNGKQKECKLESLKDGKTRVIIEPILVS
jgi:hypothetical protein